MLKASRSGVTVNIHRIVLSADYTDFAEEELAAQKHKKHKKKSAGTVRRRIAALFLSCAFCAFSGSVLFFQISRLRSAFATASVFECTCNFW
jgi:hypothetical protein